MQLSTEIIRTNWHKWLSPGGKNWVKFVDGSRELLFLEHIEYTGSLNRHRCNFIKYATATHQSICKFSGADADMWKGVLAWDSGDAVRGFSSVSYEPWEKPLQL